MKESGELKKLVQDIGEGMREYTRLAYDEEEVTKPGAPATAKQISKLEQKLGKPLPPSYRAFLELHNGWEGFSGDLKLLSVEDHDSDWVKKGLKNLASYFKAIKAENPIDQGALPLMMGEDEPESLILDPRKVRPNGEMDLIHFRYAQEEDRFKDFTSFLREKLKAWNQLIKEEKKGKSEDDDDADEKD